MKTAVLPPTEAALLQAAEWLQRGQLVAFPTETVYGLGANALDEAAVGRIFAAKGRPSSNPLILHVPDMAAAEPLCQVSPTARLLMEAFCPGPLTLLLPKKPVIPAVVNGGLSSVAIRIPAHPVAQSLLKACGLPIAAPSANTSGRPSPTTAQHVLADLEGKLPLILDGGPCALGLESTVVDLTADPPSVLRPGGVTPEMLLSVLPQVQVADSVLRPLREGETALSPGMMYRHYAPQAKLVLVQGTEEHVRARCQALQAQAADQGIPARILAFAEHLPLYDPAARPVCIGSLQQPETVAQSLFARLRQMDAEGAQLLLCEVMEPTGLGLAIMNRLRRAASFLVEDADQPANGELP